MCVFVWARVFVNSTTLKRRRRLAVFVPIKPTTPLYGCSIYLCVVHIYCMYTLTSAILGDDDDYDDDDEGFMDMTRD